MIKNFRRPVPSSDSWTVLVIVIVLLAAAVLGLRASAQWLALLVAAMAALLVVQTPPLGLLALVVVALLIPVEFGTGTEVNLNLTVLLIPALVALVLLGMMVRGRIRLVPSRVNWPLLLFLAAGLLSLAVGNLTWDPLVPRKSNFALVQVAQWSIFAMSAAAFWLSANLIKDETWLRRMTATFLLLAGGVAILRLLPGLGDWLRGYTTIAFTRAPLWTLLAALAGGQLLFNRKLSLGWRLFLVAVLVATLVYVLVEQRDTVSNWVGAAAAMGMLLWLRYPRVGWLVVILIGVLAVAGVLGPAVYEFAGGDAEWLLSGGTRLALNQRVIELTMRNPILGLGPAAYRPYGLTGSLSYGRLFYSSVALSAHNNYVDVFSHMGLVGLVLFLWLIVEIGLLGMRLRRRYRTGFTAGYVNGVLAAGTGALILMLFADWILPFVYNIGFPGFQASVLVWLFMGGLVALDNMTAPEEERGDRTA